MNEPAGPRSTAPEKENATSHDPSPRASTDTVSESSLAPSGVVQSIPPEASMRATSVRAVPGAPKSKPATVTAPSSSTTAETTRTPSIDETVPIAPAASNVTT